MDGMGSSVDGGAALHSNLTNQFMSLPFRSELSADSTDLETSLQLLQGTTGDSLPFGELPKAVAHQNSSERSGDTGNFSAESRGFFTTETTTTANADSHQNPELLMALAPEGASVSKSGAFHEIEGDFSDKGTGALAQDRYIYDRDADFLEKMGDYLEKCGDESDYSGEHRAETGSPASASSTAPATTSTNEDQAAERADDSVLVRAREYLASVHFPQTDRRAMTEEGKQSGGQTVSDLCVPPLKPVGSSTSAKRLLGRVAEDLTAETARHDSPTLASESTCILTSASLFRRLALDSKGITN